MGKRERHGLTETREYGVWCQMKSRCHSPTHKQFKDYGARGITVCDCWRNSFKAFMKYMGKRPKGGTIDRIDNNRGYEPGNCRWATQKEQGFNTRANRLLTFRGKTMPLGQWAETLGFGHSTIILRLKSGMTVDEALSTPVLVAETVTFRGRTHTVAEWSKELGIPFKTIRNRIRQKLPPAEILHVGRLLPSRR